MSEDTTKTAKKTLDPDAAKKAQAKVDARKRVVKFLADNADQLGTVKADIELLIGKKSATATSGVGVNSVLRQVMLDAHAKGVGVSEMDIFQQFRIGRPEMVIKIRILILCPNPADRVWVKLDKAEGLYHVVGLGAAMPEGWDGYDPDKKVAL